MPKVSGLTRDGCVAMECLRFSIVLCFVDHSSEVRRKGSTYPCVRRAEKWNVEWNVLYAVILSFRGWPAGPEAYSSRRVPVESYRRIFFAMRSLVLSNPAGTRTYLRGPGRQRRRFGACLGSGAHAFFQIVTELAPSPSQSAPICPVKSGRNVNCRYKY